MGQLFPNKEVFFGDREREGVLHAQDLCSPFVHIHARMNKAVIQTAMARAVSARLSLPTSMHFICARQKKEKAVKLTLFIDSPPPTFLLHITALTPFSCVCTLTRTCLIMISDKSLIKQL